MEKQYTDEEVEKFRDERFSHLDIEEFLKFFEDSLDNYTPVHLTTTGYRKLSNGEIDIKTTELDLAREALKKNCKYATHIDYCTPCIAATGLRPKTTQ